jgi:hypothetical protein
MVKLKVGRFVGKEETESIVCHNNTVLFIMEGTERKEEEPRDLTLAIMVLAPRDVLGIQVQWLSLSPAP